MLRSMKSLTVRQLARLSGVSVRTLHHYDDCGLLRPAHVGANGYRYYGEAEFLRLQQILLHRELGLSLRDIAAVLDAAGSARIEVLRGQRTEVLRSIERHRDLLATLDRTIAHLEGDSPMQAEDLFVGFDTKRQAEYEAWLVEREGPRMRERIDAGQAHLANLGAAAVQDRMAELEKIEAALAVQCRDGVASDSVALAPLVERHRAWVAFMWGRDCTPLAHAGLAELYLAHPDFIARYESRATGFARFLAEAMRANAARAQSP
jgi:DNA-binding transcriptional MerR regulator